MQRRFLVCFLMLASLVLSPFVTAGTSDLEALANADYRSEKVRARNVYRHPVATLNFFGVMPDMTVVEIWPGAAGWYTEILAPYLKDKGTLYAANFPATSDIEYFRKSLVKFKQKLVDRPKLYSEVKVTEFFPPDALVSAPAGSVDMILTFRNVHNWTKAGFDETAFKQFYTMLKPGGILGVIDHRATPGTALQKMKSSGYVTEKRVLMLAKKSGFTFVARSDINSNAKDTHNHSHGVWTLPPVLRDKDKDREKYLAIGESDRLTLKFQKPR